MIKSALKLTEGSQSGLTAGAAHDAVSIVPNDAADLAAPIRAFMVPTDGDVKITTLAGTAVTVPACKAGVVYPIGAKRVWDTGTDPATVLGLI
jgi:hypothetical protein